MSLPYVDHETVELMKREMADKAFDWFKRFQEDNPALLNRMICSVDGELDEEVSSDNFLAIIVSVYTCLSISAEKQGTTLPLVEVEVIEEVCRGAIAGGMTFLAEKLSIDNAELLSHIFSVLDKAANQQEKDILATVAGLLYASLEAQQLVEDITNIQFPTP